MTSDFRLPTPDSRLLTRAVFLDRDGTIAEDVNYCSRAEDFHMLSGAPEAIQRLKEAGFKVVVITNQSGLARGYFSQEMLGQIHAKMSCHLAQFETDVDAIYFCPHHPDDGCACRKPKPGMFLKAAADLGIDLKQSYMVGDMQSDIDGGRAAGCKTIMVKTGPHKRAENGAAPDHIAADLGEAAEWVIQDIRQDSTEYQAPSGREL